MQEKINTDRSVICSRLQQCRFNYKGKLIPATKFSAIRSPWRGVWRKSRQELEKKNFPPISNLGIQDFKLKKTKQTHIWCNVENSIYDLSSRAIKPTTTVDLQPVFHPWWTRPLSALWSFPGQLLILETSLMCFYQPAKASYRVLPTCPLESRALIRSHWPTGTSSRVPHVF